MKSLKKIDKNKVKLDLEIANNFFRKSIDKAYKNISEKANIAGFRKGKIPQQVIDVNLGRQYVLNEAASISISELYPQIISSSNIKPIDYPKVNITKIKEDEPLGFEIKVDVEPEVELPKYKGIEVKGLCTEVTDEEIEEQINNIRNRFASLEPVEDIKPAQKGDYVTIDFVGEVDGKEFEGGRAEDYQLEIGSGVLFEEFENSIMGMKKGDKKEALILLPQDMDNKNLAGRKARFTIVLKDVKKKIIPDVDQEFLQNMGGYKDIDEFRQQIKKRISEHKEKARKSKIIEDILGYLVEKTKLDLPQVMIDNRINQIKKAFDENLSKEKIKKEDYLKYIKVTEEKLNEGFKERSVREIKEYLIISALERAEKDRVEPTDEEIEKEKETLLNNYQNQEEKDKVKNYIESPEGKSDFTASVRRKKVIDFLIENAKIIEEKLKKADRSSGKKIWVPENDKKNDRGENKKLWTPDQ